MVLDGVLTCTSLTNLLQQMLCFHLNFSNTFTGLWNILRIEVKNFVDVEGVLYHFLSDSQVHRICMHICFLNKISSFKYTLICPFKMACHKQRESDYIRKGGDAERRNWSGY